MSLVPDYAPEFKEKLIKLAQSGRSLLSLEAEFGVHRGTIKRWMSKQSRAPEQKETREPVAERRDERRDGHVVLAIPDLHSPYHHEDTLAFLRAVKKRFNPTAYVCLGDELDLAALSRFPKNPDLPSAGMELSAGIEGLIPFYLEFPEMMVCVSNHTTRGHRTAFQAGIPQAFLNHISTILNAPDGWRWADEWRIDNVLYFHGDRGKSGQSAHIHYMRGFKSSVVIGHIHAFGGVNYEGKHFGANSGCLIDPQSPAFAYANGRAPGVSLGCTVIFYGRQAHFIPMILGSDGRWVGTLR